MARASRRTERDRRLVEECEEDPVPVSEEPPARLERRRWWWWWVLWELERVAVIGVEAGGSNTSSTAWNSACACLVCTAHAWL